MLKAPILPGRSPQRVTTSRFMGYLHKDQAGDGLWYDMENMSADAYPAMRTRKRRGIVKTMTAPGGLIAKDALCYVDGGTLYVNHLATVVTGLRGGEKQLVSMGAYVLIFPDKVYYNTENPSDFGSMEAEYNNQGAVTYEPCDIDGNVYSISSTSASEPDNPVNGQVWLDSSSGTLYQFSVSISGWTEIPTVYTRITFTSQGQVPRLFSRYDGAELSGADMEGLNGSKVIFALGGEAGTEADWIVVIGPAENSRTVEDSEISISRKLPQMDFVCEAQNRLWGCYYGMSGGKVVNEIYGSALGDFKNFRQYQGLATDSWAASVGSDGQWTGAVNYLGHPCFFKEGRIHTVTISAAGAHRLDETVCRGVQKGSHKSLQVVGETLFYKSITDVCAWQGGFPQSVSEALSDVRYENACAGAWGQKYYLSMQSAKGWNTFCYDIGKGIWTLEDELHAMSWAAVGEELFAIDAESGALLAVNGTEGEKESLLPWMVETGTERYETVDKKYVQRYTISLTMARGSSAAVYLQYDSSGDWIQSGEIRAPGTSTVTLPIRPRRCDHLKLRIVGVGDVTIYAISRLLAGGSER